MKRSLSIKTAASSILLLAVLFQASAQSSPDTTASGSSTETAEKKSIHSFYGGAGAGSNMNYLGYTLSQDNPFGFGFLSYGLKDKLYLSATAYTLSNLSPFIAYYNIDLSFAHTFNSWFDISLSLSRYNVQKELRDTLFNNFNYASATFGFDWKILYSTFSVGGLIYEDSQLYIQAKNSRYFETPSFAGGKAFFYFDPYVNLLIGNIISVETVEETTAANYNGRNPWSHPGESTSTTQYTEKFGFMEIDFGLPVAFSYDFFTVEVEPGYILPLYQNAGTSSIQGFLILVSAFFRIF
jgi:hypothetical protein